MRTDTTPRYEESKVLNLSGRFPAMNQNWSVYVIRCSDDTLYTGITTDMDRRFRQHAEGTGAKYFRGRSPEQIVYLENGHTRSSASTREKQIKTMTRAEKDFLVSTYCNR